MRWVLGILLLAAFILGVSGVGCFEGGANFNQQKPGNNDQGGVDLGGGGGGGSWTEDDGGMTRYRYGAIAVAPGGGYFLSAAAGALILGDLERGESFVVDSVGSPARVAFAAKVPRFYVSSAVTGQVYAVDPRTRAVAWHVGSTNTRLYPSPDDRLLLVAGDYSLSVRDAATGQELSWLAPGTIVDVDVTPDGGRAVLTLRHTWDDAGPHTQLLLLDLATFETSMIGVPNCSSPLVLTPDGTKAFLAPTFCNRDPVSVIDLEAGTFVKNLPGFGPVDMASDGVTAVAFMDKDKADPGLFDDPAAVPPANGPRYYLMLLDTRTLTFATVALGDALPRYALTPDGQVVLVDSPGLWSSGAIRVLDVATRTLQPVAGPDVRLDHFVVSPSSKDVYLLYVDELYWLSIPQRSVAALEAPFRCQAINITPDGAALLLLDPAGTVKLYDLASRSVTSSILPPPVAGP